MSACPGPAQERELVGPKIGIVAIHVRIASHMAPAGRRQRQEIRPERAFVGGAIGPERAARLPKRRPKAGVVCNGVLNDERLDALGMG